MTDVLNIQFGGRCEKHLKPKPCPQCLEESSQPAAQQERKPNGCRLGCTVVCKAEEHGCASECPALPWKPTAQQERKHTEAEVHRILYFVHVDFLKEAEEKVRAILGVPAPKETPSR